VRDPDRQGKVESGVGHAKKTPLKGQRFETIEAAQAYLDHWEERWVVTRIHGTAKRQVAAMCPASTISAMFDEEKPALLPLAVEPFRYCQYGQRTVNLDGCVEVDAAYHGAPPGWIGRRVQVQWDLRHVRLLHPQTGELLREHLPQVRGKHRIQDEDRPKQTPPGTQHLSLRADRLLLQTHRGGCGGGFGAGFKAVAINRSAAVRRRRVLASAASRSSSKRRLCLPTPERLQVEAASGRRPATNRRSGWRDRET